MASIHHTQLKKAEKYGLEIRPEDDRFVVVHDASNREWGGSDLKKLLEDTIAAVTGESGGETTRPGSKKGDVAPTPKPTGEDADDAEDDEEAPVRRVGFMLKGYYDNYCANGRSCGDDVAGALKEYCTKEDEKGKSFCDRDVLREVAKENDIDLESRWGHLNTGMARMNLSNVLRAMIRDGIPVTVGGQPVKI